MNKIINGLVLAGGSSSRMGKDKGLITYHGKPQREHLADLLKPYCTEVFISCLRCFNSSITVIPDHFNLSSPLNGILSAFHFDPEAAWLTVPIDMPNIDSAAIEYLIKNRNPKKLATCFTDSEGTSPEPLFTLWEPKAKPVLFDFFNSGGTSPRKFLIENDVQLIQAPKANLLLNINTEDELAVFLKNGRS
jgi:molybdopterin-guanine dinucleotide biosynthesis protein A